MPHTLPIRPWEKVGCDLFKGWQRLFGYFILVTVDYYSNFWELDELESDTTSETIIMKLKAHFAHYSSPMQVISDNGPQFISEAFQRLLHNGISNICVVALVTREPMAKLNLQ